MTIIELLVAFLRWLLENKMQYFRARANLPKALLYAINGGIDELTKTSDTCNAKSERWLSLIFDDVWNSLIKWWIGWQKLTSKLWTSFIICTINILTEAYEMALHDDDVITTQTCGIAGISIIADSFCSKWNTEK